MDQGLSKLNIAKFLVMQVLSFWLSCSRRCPCWHGPCGWGCLVSCGEIGSRWSRCASRCWESWVCCWPDRILPYWLGRSDRLSWLDWGWVLSYWLGGSNGICWFHRSWILSHWLSWKDRLSWLDGSGILPYWLSWSNGLGWLNGGWILSYWLSRNNW